MSGTGSRNQTGKGNKNNNSRNHIPATRRGCRTPSSNDGSNNPTNRFALLTYLKQGKDQCRLTTLVIFIAYGLITSKIVVRKRRWGENLLKSKAKIHALLHAIPDALLRIRGDATLLVSVTEKENGSIDLPELFLGKISSPLCHREARIVKTGSDEVLAILRDISDRKVIEEKLRTLSLTDELTGMNNHRGFFLLSEQQLKRKHVLTAEKAQSSHPLS
jgi:hypothetical protein